MCWCLLQWQQILTPQRCYSVSQTILLPLRFSSNIFQKTENFQIKFYTPIAHTYLCRIIKFFVGLQTKLCHIERDHLVNFYIIFTRETIDVSEKCCGLCATVWPIATKFGTTMQNVSLKWMAVKNFSFKNPRWRTASSQNIVIYRFSRLTLYQGLF